VGGPVCANALVGIHPSAAADMDVLFMAFRGLFRDITAALQARRVAS